MRTLYLFTAALALNASLSLSLSAQTTPCPAVPDVVTIQLGQPFSYNVTTNDGAVGCPVRLQAPSDCILLAPKGDLSLRGPMIQTAAVSMTSSTSMSLVLEVGISAPPL